MLKIFNVLKNSKEIFKTFFYKKVFIYVCGITVYDFCHLGHGRTFIVFDMIIRYLKYLGYKVKYIRNITDIDDKIIKKSFKNNENFFCLVDRIIKSMKDDFYNLNILLPDVEPRVTHNIKIIIKFIMKLLDLKNAYISKNGDIMFSISSFKSYGKLSKQILSNLIKKNNNINFLNKKKSKDFVLWKLINKKDKKYKNNISWKSPWGNGRPGWHIECSALSYKYCGKVFDIHGGGLDLLFPHHENERSQSSCFLDNKKYVKYWIHSGLLIFKNCKMSKSLKNFYSLKQAILNYDSDTIRYFFLSIHYRKPLIYTKYSLRKSRLSMERLYYSLLNTKTNNCITEESTMFEKKFMSAMNNDFNTPKAISILFDISKRINIEKKNNVINSNILSTKLIFLGKILGFFYLSCDDFFKKQKIRILKNIISISKIEILIDIRNFSRKNKNWGKSDNIRKKFNSIGILLEDNYNKTFWKIK
ncbi:cysteine--tRNA ligase [Buchnera aphidicola (Ceratovacuna keduensis)]|uniref:cysteine--tRNA ligase n=1 Tax=Buchnera aphidicola TaxID=9 RepID=UPI0031B7FB22